MITVDCSEKDLKNLAIRLLNKYGIRPRKRLGQNFIICSKAIKLIVEKAEVLGNDVIFEIGGGLGFLTRELAKKAKKVYTIEIDPKLVNALKEVLSEYNNIFIIHGDVLKIPIPNDVTKVVSNLPYSISSKITFKLLNTKINEFILTYQKEVAERILAEPGSSEYGRLTVMVNLYVTVQPLIYISKKCFYPTPKVDSLTIKLKQRRNRELLEHEEALFSKLTRKLFTQRNKVWWGVLKKILLKKQLSQENISKIIDELKLVIKAERVRNLSTRDLILMTRIISKYCQNI